MPKILTSTVRVPGVVVRTTVPPALVLIPSSEKTLPAADWEALGLAATGLAEGDEVEVAPGMPQAADPKATTMAASSRFIPEVSLQLRSKRYRCRLRDIGADLAALSKRAGVAPGPLSVFLSLKVVR
jgi:hypothetical protein